MYQAISLACYEIIWLCGLLSEFGFVQDGLTPLHVDNTSVIQIMVNLVYHERTKLIVVDCHSKLLMLVSLHLLMFLLTYSLRISSSSLSLSVDIIFLLAN